MYSDRINSSGAGSRKRSIKDRLGVDVQSGDEPARQNYSKRFQGFDGHWQHDMYDDVDNNRSKAKSEQISVQDLRYKLKKNVSRGGQRGNDASGGIKDLREKLSGPMPPPQMHTQTVSMPQQRTASAVKVTAPAVTTVPGSKPPAASVKPSSAPKVSTGVDVVTIASFLQSLGLSKYLITFQAEEIDMSVLRVMKDDELKELGIPMGPRKKITLALASQSKR